MRRFERDGRPVVEIGEWEAPPEHVRLALTDADRSLATSLATGAGRVFVDEMRDGLRVRATSWIGVVSFASFDLQIVPKYVGESLGVLGMVDFTRGTDALRRQAGVRRLALGGAHLLDLVALLAADPADRLIRDGLLQDYVTREDALGVVRGRLLWYEQATRHPGRVDTLECRFDEFETDIDENRLVCAGLNAARRLVHHPDVRGPVTRTSSIFAEVCDPALLESRWLDGPHEYDRRNERYRNAHEYARLLLRGLGVTDLYTPSSSTSFAFLIDMNSLFEDFVTQLLNVGLRALGLAPNAQRRISGRIVDDRSGRTYRNVIPDIVVRGWGPKGPREVPLDAKYKLYGRGRLIENADLYQLFFYAFIHRSAMVGESPPSAYVVYPVQGEDQTHLRFVDLHGVPGARLRGVGIDVASTLEMIARGTVGDVPAVRAVAEVFSRMPLPEAFAPTTHSNG